MIFLNEIKTKFIIIFIAIFVLIAVFLFVYSIHLRKQTIDSYQFFLKRWESQQLNNYLLNYSSSGCIYTIQVTNGIPKIIKTANSSSNNDICEFYKPRWLEQKQPMTSLFKDLIQFSYPQCGANGCICDNIDNLIIRFDKKLGYIQSWKEINSGGFTPYVTARFPGRLACHLMFSKHIDFSVDLRPI